MSTSSEQLAFAMSNVTLAGFGGLSFGRDGTLIEPAALHEQAADPIEAQIAHVTQQINTAQERLRNTEDGPAKAQLENELAELEKSKQELEQARDTGRGGGAAGGPLAAGVAGAGVTSGAFSAASLSNAVRYGAISARLDAGIAARSREFSSVYGTTQSLARQLGVDTRRYDGIVSHFDRRAAEARARGDKVGEQLAEHGKNVGGYLASREVLKKALESGTPEQIRAAAENHLRATDLASRSAIAAQQRIELEADRLGLTGDKRREYEEQQWAQFRREQAASGMTPKEIEDSKRLFEDPIRAAAERARAQGLTGDALAQALEAERAKIRENAFKAGLTEEQIKKMEGAGFDQNTARAITAGLPPIRPQPTAAGPTTENELVAGVAPSAEVRTAAADATRGIVAEHKPTDAAAATTDPKAPKAVEVAAQQQAEENLLS